MRKQGDRDILPCDRKEKPFLRTQRLYVKYKKGLWGFCVEGEVGGRLRETGAKTRRRERRWRGCSHIYIAHSLRRTVKHSNLKYNKIFFFFKYNEIGGATPYVQHEWLGVQMKLSAVAFLGLWGNIYMLAVMVASLSLSPSSPIPSPLCVCLWETVGPEYSTPASSCISFEQWLHRPDPPPSYLWLPLKPEQDSGADVEVSNGPLCWTQVIGRRLRPWLLGDPLLL